ncbi:MAG: FAD-binding oxidoreductase [Sulfolobaceae archaeon]|nr:FAD-binding oxidoreductase [Sulfolobaceae archaeon]
MDWIDELNKITEVKDGIKSEDVRTKVTVFPSTYEEVSEVVKFAVSKGLTIYTFGNNSNHIGAKVDADIGLGTKRLNNVILISEEDLYVTAQSGVDFKELAEMLKKYGLQIPFNYEGSLGGFASTNLPSIFTWFGYPKDWLLGAKIATGLGEVIKSGGTTTKFSSGYKIWKVLSGSLGYLGIYLELNVRLIPYNDYHFEEVQDYERAFKDRALGVIGIRGEGEGKKKRYYAVLRGEGEKVEVPQRFDASIVTVRGMEMEVMDDVAAETCIAYYGNGLIRCNGVDVEGLRKKGFVVIKERKCDNNCFGYYYNSLELLKNSLDPHRVFFNIFR